MIPSPASSSAGVLRRMLIEASSHIRCSDEDQTFAEGQRIEHSDLDCQLEDIQVHGRMDGVDSWNNVIADTMLSMSASPRPQSELVFDQRRNNANISTLANDSDSDAPQDLQLSPNDMDDDDDEDDDEGDNILAMSMDQDSQGLYLPYLTYYIAVLYLQPNLSFTTLENHDVGKTCNPAIFREISRPSHNVEVFTEMFICRK